MRLLAQLIDKDVDSLPDAGIPTIGLAQVNELARPLVDILPLQILTLVMAK